MRSSEMSILQNCIRRSIPSIAAWTLAAHLRIKHARRAALRRHTRLHMKTFSAISAFIGVANAFSSTPLYPPDVTVKGESQDCDNSQCFNRLHPLIPMAVVADPGDIILFDTPTATADVKQKDQLEDNLAFDPSVINIGTLHQLAGPVGIRGAKAGDKIAIKILDIEAQDWGWNHANTNVGYLSDMVQAPWFNWWQPQGGTPGHPEFWVNDRFPDVAIPFHPFPGIVVVLPSSEVVAHTKARELAVSAQGGTANPPGSLLNGVTGDYPSAYPSEICGEDGSDPQNCLRTIAPDVYYGNVDSQRLAPGSTLIVDCFVDECGIGIGDVHGAQGDGEVSITAIEIEALVKVQVEIITPEDPRYVLPSPTTVGTTSIKDYSPSTGFVSFHGFPDREEPLFPLDEANDPWPVTQHAVFADAVRNYTHVAENLSLAGRNALLKCIKFMHDVLGYTFTQGLTLASVAVDLRVAQVVDKPMVGMEAILPIHIFNGEARRKIEAAIYGPQ